MNYHTLQLSVLSLFFKMKGLIFLFLLIFKANANECETIEPDLSKFVVKKFSSTQVDVSSVRSVYTNLKVFGSCVKEVKVNITNLIEGITKELRITGYKKEAFIIELELGVEFEISIELIRTHGERIKSDVKKYQTFCPDYYKIPPFKKNEIPKDEQVGIIKWKISY